MDVVFQHIINAISIGSLYALLALGVALCYGVMSLINFAHGELIMIGGYAMVVIQHPPLPVLILGTILVVVAVAMVMERAAFRPVRGADITTLLITSFAVSYLLQNLAIMIFGARPKSYSLAPSLTDGTLVMGAVEVPWVNVATIVVTIVLVGGLIAFLNRTRMGVQMRAAAQDFEMARLCGISANRVIATAFGISGILAAGAALLLVAQFGTISPQMGLAPVIIAFIATVIGGLGSLSGAAAGGFLLGALTILLEVVLPVYLRPYRDAFLFSIVIAILVFRPQGLIPNATGEVKL